MKAMHVHSQKLDDMGNPLFPLVCISLNITQMIMQAFLDGRLSTLCNRAEDNKGVLMTLCEVHAAAMWRFYDRFRTQRRTVADTEKTKKEIQADLHANPAKFLQMFGKGIAAMKEKSRGEHLV